MVYIFARVSRIFACRLVAACSAFLFSAGAIGLELGESLFSELVGTPAIHLVFGLTKNTRQLPIAALSEPNYVRLVAELRAMAAELPTGTQRLSKEDVKRLEVLSAKIQMLADQRITGRCAKLSIDPVSAARSGGDWRLATQADGTPIKPSYFSHYDLFFYFAWGCGGEKDFAAARRVLFDMSDLAPKKLVERSELRLEIRHCLAAMWAQYGIGGPVNEEEALEFSKRYTKQAWFSAKEDGPEQRAALALRYPQAAKDNFSCPREGQEQMRIDPRDPWKNLW